MSTKAVFKGIAALLMMFMLGGCITTDVEITLNPDGSGTMEYTRSFNPSTDKDRMYIQGLIESRDLGMNDLTEHNIRDKFPEPHFNLTNYQYDPDHLKTRFTLHFKDINALLIQQEKDDFCLNKLDFVTIRDSLIFTVKEEEIDRSLTVNLDETPGRETISIINAKSGKKTTFSRELTSNTQLANWCGRLHLPGHTIQRDPNIRLFHAYPVVKADSCKISRADWTISQNKRSLNIELYSSIPADGMEYLRWEKPIVLSGNYTPQSSPSSPPLVIKGSGNLNNAPSEKIRLQIPVPERDVTALEQLSVRIKAYRAAESKIINLGPLKPNTQYETNGLILKTDDLNKNQVGFRISGETDPLKSAWLQTQRGNRFKLKRISSYKMNFEEAFPLKGCDLCVELHIIEPCYIDLTLPSLDLTQRGWNSEKPATKRTDWKQALQAEHPELFNITIPPVTATTFANRSAFSTYFQALENEQILPAILAVSDYIIRDDPKNGKLWIQTIVSETLKTRSEYLAANREFIAAQLFGICKYAPQKLTSLYYFFGYLDLKDLSQPAALAEIKNGNLRFANCWFFGHSTLPQPDIVMLTHVLLHSEDHDERAALFPILSQTHSASTSILLQLFSNESQSTYTRRSALNMLLKDEKVSPVLLIQKAAKGKENTLRSGLVKTILLACMEQRDEFPTEVFSACLIDLSTSQDAISALEKFTDSLQQSSQSDPAQIKQWLETIQSLIPILEDLSEQLNHADAQPAIIALEKIHKLQAAANQE
jgi:hypothetical protein